MWFAWLCGVRDGMEEDMPRFSREPRGLPPDLSVPVWDEVNRWGGDGHSHSWLTLKELETTWKEQSVIHFLGSDHYPEPIELYTPLEMWKGLSPEKRGPPPKPPALELRDPFGGMSEGKWMMSISHFLQSYYERWRDYLWGVKWAYDLHGPSADEDVRIVFFFDN